MNSELKSRIQFLKNQIDVQRPLNKAQLAILKDYYRVGLTFSSNALEGNTLDISETKVVIEDGLTIGGKPLKDHFEVLGHAESFDYIFDNFENLIITENVLKNIHKLFYNRIDVSQAGQFRTIDVVISGSEYVPPSAKNITKEMKTFFDFASQFTGKDPIEYAAKIHLDFVIIHPFVDGNGRVSRLLMNLALLKSGYPVVTISPLLRAKYIAALNRASMYKDSEPFIDFVAECVYESLKDYQRMFLKNN